mgnify:FL=1|tara:strand:+ start:122 stop:562 length:441 start_codon:yes stop_codon:yes gene_type:complete
MNEINIIYNHKFQHSINKKNLKNYCKKVLNYNNYESYQVSLIFTDHDQLREMKKEYFKQDLYTDVIAFNLNSIEEDLEGEIYLSIHMIESNANDYSVSLENELKRVVAHGLLHLVGYEDQRDQDKLKMIKMENTCMQLFNNLDIIY